MQNVITYQKMISTLEDKKWNILNQRGEIAAMIEWIPIDKRLTHLYRWWAKDIGNSVRKDENLEQREDLIRQETNRQL